MAAPEARCRYAMRKPRCTGAASLHDRLGLRPMTRRAGVRAAVARGAARSQAAGACERAAAGSRRARGARADFRQALHRRIPAAAPSRMRGRLRCWSAAS